MKLVTAGIEPKEVTIPRQLCQLSFPQESCASHGPWTSVKMPSAEAITTASKPHPLVLVVKLGVGSPFSGDRAQILTQIVSDVCAVGGVQLVFLIDHSEWTKQSHYEVKSSIIFLQIPFLPSPRDLHVPNP